MKGKYIYIIIAIWVTAVAFLLIMNAKNKPKKFEERITLRKTDKIPYGSYLAYENLQWIFPKTDILLNRSYFSEAGWFLNEKEKQALIIISPQFLADEDEMYDLIDFAQRGNDVFISTRRLSVTAMESFNSKSSFSFDAIDLVDSLILTLKKPAFQENIVASYPGRKFNTYLYEIDSSITQVLAVDEEGDPNFVRFQTGSGNIFLHLAPLAFSNYFMLHKNNIKYYEQLLSVLPPDPEVIIWDEYYLNKKWNNEAKNDNSWLSVLFQYPGLKAGLLTAIITLLIFILMESRRRQRIVPVIPAVRNESLEFIKTIGRLYHEKGDHKNLVHKMSQYFLDHVRNKFYISTRSLDENFLKSLHQKSGYPEFELKEITDFILFIETSPAISENQMAKFHNQLEKFYKNT